MPELMKLTDIVIANEEDVQMTLGIEPGGIESGRERGCGRARLGIL